MVQVKLKLDKGAYQPTCAHDSDAGYDMRSREDAELWPGESHVFDTGVHMAIPDGYFGAVLNKSGLNINYGVESKTGVIDAGYTGSIRIKLKNDSEDMYTVHAGDKISQIVIIPCTHIQLIEVDELDGTERGENGFGSTGRQ